VHEQEEPREYLHDQILADSMIFSPEGIRHLVAEMGPSQVVYGTDMPFVWPDTVGRNPGSRDFRPAERSHPGREPGQVAAPVNMGRTHECAGHGTSSDQLVVAGERLVQSIENPIPRR